MRVAGAICGSAQIVTDIRIGSDDWLALFMVTTSDLRVDIAAES